MQIIKTFNTDKNSVLNKKFNIFVPICLGNKFFINKYELTKHVEEYIEFALKHTKEKVIILIADKIQATNYAVRNKKSFVISQENVLLERLKIKNKVLELIKNNFPKNTNLEVISYSEYEQGDLYNRDTTLAVYKEFKNNPEFARAVFETVKTTQKDRKFTDQEHLKLADYILDEFSLVYSGLTYKGIYYGVFLYPNIDSTVYLIENIQLGNLFKKLSDILPRQKCGVVILNKDNLKDVQSYYNTLTPTYESLINSKDVNVKTHDEVVKIFKRHKIKSGSILDLGCGPGNLKKILKKHIKIKYSFTGIDISENMLTLAKQGSGYNCLHGFAEEILPMLPDKSFDYIVAISCLHFVKDIQSLLVHMERVARKGVILTFDQMNKEYRRGFQSVCDSLVFDYFDMKVNGITFDYSFIGWTSPRENKPVKVRLVYKKLG